MEKKRGGSCYSSDPRRAVNAEEAQIVRGRWDHGAGARGGKGGMGDDGTIVSKLSRTKDATWEEQQIASRKEMVYSVFIRGKKRITKKKKEGERWRCRRKTEKPA